MKKLKQCLAALLGAALLFTTACGSGDGSGGGAGGSGTSTTGRYVELDISPVQDNDDGFYLFRAANGGLIAFNGDYSRRWDSADAGDSWSESAGPLAGQSYMAVGLTTLMEDGSLIAEVYDENYMTQVIRVSREGTAEPLAIPAWDDVVDTGAYVHTLHALPGGKLLFGFQWGFGSMMGMLEEEAGETDDETPDDEDADEEPGPIVDGSNAGEYGFMTGLFDLATGEVIRDYGEDFYPSGVAYDTTNFYALEYDGSVTAYSLADGAQGEGLGQFAQKDNTYLFVVAYDMLNGTHYYANENSLQTMTDEGVEVLLDGAAFSFGNPTASIQSMVATQEGDPILSMYETNLGHIYKYVWDPEAPIDPDKTLRVWSLEENNVVRAAISAFRRQYPEGTITYEVALSGSEDAKQADDAIKNLNNAILAGNGPDVIILDGVPMDSYISQGVLTDLTNLVDTSGVYQNLMQPFVGTNGIYAVPGRLRMPVLVGAEADLDAAASLDALLAAVSDTPDPANAWDYSPLSREERPAFAFDDFDEIFNLLWNTSASDIIADGTLNTEALSAFLEAIKAFSDKYRLTENTGEESGGGAIIVSDGGSSGDIITGSLLQYLVQRTIYAGYTAGDILIMDQLMEAEGSTFAAFPGLTTGVWLPEAIAGISDSSNRKELAGEFIGMMLSDDVQGVRIGGLPITQSGMQTQVENLNKLYEEAMEQAEQMGIEMEPMEFTLDMDALIATLTTPTIVDAGLTDEVYKAAHAYASGSQSLDGAMQAVEQVVRTWLAERS